MLGCISGYMLGRMYVGFSVGMYAGMFVGVEWWCEVLLCDWLWGGSVAARVVRGSLSSGLMGCLLGCMMGCVMGCVPTNLQCGECVVM